MTSSNSSWSIACTSICIERPWKKSDDGAIGINNGPFPSLQKITTTNNDNINRELFYKGQWKNNKKNGKGYFEFQKGHVHIKNLNY